jgi:uncharacterized membrane protein YfhO
VEAPVGAGQTVFVQISYDTPWRAFANGKEIPVQKAQLGFIRLDTPPGYQDIVLEFQLPAENKVGRVLTALTVLAVVGMVAYRRRSL